MLTDINWLYLYIIAETSSWDGRYESFVSYENNILCTHANENETLFARNDSGVDYLAPGALTESMSYVFGPVLKLLKAKGYIEGVDLDAAPYDWRIHPGQLQSRDRYFSNTMAKIENLYRKSNNTPVVLLCHSMGCKTGHYLLNFVLRRLGKADGQAWLDR